jgi:hypothetical protein
VSKLSECCSSWKLQPYMIAAIDALTLYALTSAAFKILHLIHGAEGPSSERVTQSRGGMALMLDYTVESAFVRQDTGHRRGLRLDDELLTSKYLEAARQLLAGTRIARSSNSRWL